MPYINRDNNPNPDKLLYVLGPAGQKGDTGATGATGPQGPQGPVGSNFSFTDIKLTNYTAQIGEFVRVGGEGVVITLPDADSAEGSIGVVVIEDVTCSVVTLSDDPQDTINGSTEPIQLGLNQSIILSTAGDIHSWYITSWVPIFP